MMRKLFLFFLLAYYSIGQVTCIRAKANTVAFLYAQQQRHSARHSTTSRNSPPFVLLSQQQRDDDEDDSSKELLPVNESKQTAGLVFLGVLCAWHFVIGPALREPILALREQL